ncbi:MAG: mechanosensitive ion channel [Saprospiraceae bacterium]|nr:mechanosensitive ion channel [Saprospiraceae bacterium]
MPGMEILNKLLTNLALGLPKVFMAILLFFAGWLIAKLISKLLKKLLQKVGLDTLGEKLNEIDLVRNSNFNFQPSLILARIVYYFLILIFLVAATDVLQMDALSQLVSRIINYIPQLITAMVLVVIGLLLADLVQKGVRTATESLGIPSGNIISGFIFWFVFLTVGVSALSQAGIDTDFIKSNLTVVLAGGVLAFALGYGLASKEIVGNFLAAFYHKNKIQIGDHIKIDGVKGEVVEMDRTSFTLQTETGKVVMPLMKLSTENIEIFSTQ